MKKILLYISIFVCVIASSQEITLYNLRSVTQSTDVNPAFQPNYTWHLNLPILSSINVGATNNGFTLNDYLKEDTLNNFFSKLESKNVARLYFSTGILDFGFRVKNVYITFRSQLKNELELKYSNSFINIIEGNYNAISQMPKNIDFGSETGIYGNSYLETGVGASVKVNEHLTVGANLKYLMGIANAEMKFNKFKLTPSGDNLTYEIEGSLKVNGVPLELTSTDSSLNNIKSKTNNYKFSTKNSGFGVDLGAVYDDFFIKGLQLSLSVNDLGFISWAAENSSEAILKSTYTFSGADLSKATANNGEKFDMGSDISDKIKKNTKVIPKNESSNRTTSLIPKINLGVNYSVTSWFDVNTLMRSLYYSDQFNNQISLGGTLKSRFCDFALNYSYLSRSFANVGTGVNLKLGAFNMYFITDNVLASFFPKDAKNFGLRFGMNFVFGNVKKRSAVDPEKKGIENYDTPSDSTKSKKDDDFDKKKKEIDEKMENKKKELEKIDKEDTKKEEGKKEEGEKKNF